jgi:hypothetical protein
VIKRTLQLGTITGLVIGGTMAVGATALPSVFSSDAQVIAMARRKHLAMRSVLDAALPTSPPCCSRVQLFVAVCKDAW